VKQDKATHNPQDPPEEAQALNDSMEQAIKQSMRELARWCHHTAQDQHSKANSSCCVFTRLNREQMLGGCYRGAVTPRIRKKDIVPSITEVISRPGNIPRAASFRFRQGFLWRCRSEEQQQVGRQDKHPVRRERW
jgi:hypothetical protein